MFTMMNKWELGALFSYRPLTNPITFELWLKACHVATMASEEGSED